MVWFVVVGVQVFVSWVVNCFVPFLVPAFTYPALCVAEAVIKPDELTVILGVAWVIVATDFEA